MVALRKPAPMTVAEFLDWDPGGAPGRWQLIDGEPVMMAPARDRHGALVAEFARRLGNRLAESGSPCRVVAAPGVVPRVGRDTNFRIPDLGITCAPPSDRVIVDDPILLIEILSPGNEVETLANVWAFTTIPTVREILMVRSNRMELALLRRDDQGRWPEEPTILRPPAALLLDSVDFDAPVIELYRGSGLETP
jgi:Uma2 family endonuclease